MYLQPFSVNEVFNRSGVYFRSYSSYHQATMSTPAKRTAEEKGDASKAKKAKAEEEEENVEEEEDLGEEEEDLGKASTMVIQQLRLCPHGLRNAWEKPFGQSPTEVTFYLKVELSLHA